MAVTPSSRALLSAPLSSLTSHVFSLTVSGSYVKSGSVLFFFFFFFALGWTDQRRLPMRQNGWSRVTAIACESQAQTPHLSPRPGVRTTDRQVQGNPQTHRGRTPRELFPLGLVDIDHAEKTRELVAEDDPALSFDVVDIQGRLRAEALIFRSRDSWPRRNIYYYILTVSGL